MARGVALTSTNPGDDLVHIVEREPVDLVITDGRQRLFGEGVPQGDGTELLERAPCDVAILVAKEQDPIELGPDHPILVPFGGAEHDWAALELGSWLAASTGSPLKLLGAGGQTDETKSVTRMLADAGLLVQQATGVSTEPLVVAGGRDSIVDAARGAGLLVLGLSERWKREGLGATERRRRRVSRTDAVRAPRHPSRPVRAEGECHAVQVVDGGRPGGAAVRTTGVHAKRDDDSDHRRTRSFLNGQLR